MPSGPGTLYAKKLEATVSQPPSPARSYAHPVQVELDPPPMPRLLSHFAPIQKKSPGAQGTGGRFKKML